jgi:thioesterase domain-containing protein
VSPPDESLDLRVQLLRRSPLTLHVVDAWRDVLGVEEPAPSDNFFDQGGTSVQALLLATRVGEATGKELAVESVFTCETLDELVEHVIRLPLGESVDPLVRLARGGSRALLCMHSVTGSAYRNARLANFIDDVSLLGLQSVGASRLSLRDMATRYATRWAQEKITDYVILGYSFGGVLAEAFAGNVTTTGGVARPQHVIVVDSSDPASWSVPDPLWPTALGMLRSSFGLATEVSAERGRAKALADTARALSRLAGDLSTAEVERWLEPIESNLGAMAGHVLDGRYDGPLTFIKAEDTSIPPAWKDRATDVITVPGDHYSMFDLDDMQGVVSVVKGIVTNDL